MRLDFKAPVENLYFNGFKTILAAHDAGRTFLRCGMWRLPRLNFLSPVLPRWEYRKIRPSLGSRITLANIWKSGWLPGLNLTAEIELRRIQRCLNAAITDHDSCSATRPIWLRRLRWLQHPIHCRQWAS